MKKSLFSLLILVSIVASATGQRSALGISIGSGFSSTRNEYSSEAWKQGFIINLEYSWYLTRRLALRTGLAFEKKGSKFDPVWCATGEFENPYNVHFDYYYASIPVLVNLSFGQKIKYNVYAGPYFSRLLRTDLDANDEFRNDVIVEQASNHRAIDFGLSTGTSIDIPIAKNLCIPIELRYNCGLLNTSKERLHHYNVIDNKTYSEDMVVKHNALYLMIGLKANL
ncbi:porin family protein [Owenweeksia hongkongensis]|uniref:Outer membrane protein beta-barrel domain-containing protein n=1 Tax=Owenweeksia hongkongensis (strain DSM 17368 / CIP 108786 / JCM 12287 / NRRL B-23963 / UST20020801) TaxID=926562 RepID=G8R3Y5_OWEHD|nr:porin family protein [Owenweeksia hongkongensis]AEV32017.1 hypothetical protein Oweho_1008 [Owenweeksia hongkongensis DSM 17368]